MQRQRVHVRFARAGQGQAGQTVGGHVDGRTQQQAVIALRQQKARREVGRLEHVAAVQAVIDHLARVRAAGKRQLIRIQLRLRVGLAVVVITGQNAGRDIQRDHAPGRVQPVGRKPRRFRRNILRKAQIFQLVQQALHRRAAQRILKGRGQVPFVPRPALDAEGSIARKGDRVDQIALDCGIGHGVQRHARAGEHVVRLLIGGKHARVARYHHVVGGRFLGQQIADMEGQLRAVGINGRDGDGSVGDAEIRGGQAVAVLEIQDDPLGIYLRRIPQRVVQHGSAEIKARVAIHGSLTVPLGDLIGFALAVADEQPGHIGACAIREQHGGILRGGGRLIGSGAQQIRA